MTGGVAVTAAAAVAAAAVVLAGAPPASRPQTPPPGAVPGAHQSARSFLLASAVKAASAPATTGAFWYVKERDFEPTTGVTKTRKLFLPGITYAETQETWTGQTRTRTIVDEDLRFSFASAADKAKWEAAGKPPLPAAGSQLGSTQPETSNYNFGYGQNLGVGVHLTLAGFRRLPTTAAALGATLHRMWNSIPGQDKAGVLGLPHPDFYGYLFAWATSVLGGPATPGTRAAMYQLLAQQPGITIVRSVTDPLGRTGVAVADAEGYGGRDYMVIDPQTAQLLAYTTYPVHPNSTIPTTGGGTEANVATGWTNQIGVPPRS
jgi:hypothetical protein